MPYFAVAMRADTLEGECIYTGDVRVAVIQASSQPAAEREARALAQRYFPLEAGWRNHLTATQQIELEGVS